MSGIRKLELRVPSFFKTEDYNYSPSILTSKGQNLQFEIQLSTVETVGSSFPRLHFTLHTHKRRCNAALLWWHRYIRRLYQRGRLQSKETGLSVQQEQAKSTDAIVSDGWVRGAVENQWGESWIIHKGCKQPSVGQRNQVSIFHRGSRHQKVGLSYLAVLCSAHAQARQSESLYCGKRFIIPAYIGSWKGWD